MAILAATQDKSPRLRYPSGKAARLRESLCRALLDCSLRKQFNIA